MNMTKKVTRIYGIFISLIVMLLVFLYFLKPFSNEKTDSKPYESGTTNALINGQTLSQTFSLKETASDISFRIATFLQTIETGSLNVTIYDSRSGDIKAAKDFQASDLVDNQTLTLDAPLNPGEYRLEITPAGIDEGKQLAIYASSSTDLPCQINGVQQSNSIFLVIEYNQKERVKRIFGALVSGVILMMSAMFIVQIIKDIHLGVDKKITIIGRYSVCLLCLVIAAVLLWINFDSMISSNVIDFMREQRESFYLIVVLVSISLYLLNQRSPLCGWALIAMIGLIWIFTDSKYNVIDEGAHTEIIQYILSNKGVFPLVSENYEAVQGPLYYYITALLTGWLPFDKIYMGGRIFGFVLLILYGGITRRTLEMIKNARWYHGNEALLNIIWMLFTINPHMLIRFTRVSNEALMCVFTAAAISLITHMVIYGWNGKNILLTTIICALAFLTKATSAFLVVLIFLICVYYKKWKMLILQALIYLVMVSPWFIDNIIKYGALTGMKGHLEFVMPIVNPEGIMPDIRGNILHYFGNYFLNWESGRWFDYAYIDGLLTPLLLLLTVVSFFIGMQYLFDALFRKKLQFSGNDEERKKTLFLLLSVLPVISILMHVIQTVMTLNNSLAQNRYSIMLNIGFCSMLLLGMCSLSERSKKILNWIITATYSYFIVSMIGGYIEISTRIAMGI